MGFCFVAVSLGCLCAQQKLCSAWDTSENQHNCTNCSQFLAEWSRCHISQQALGREHLMVPQMEIKGCKEKTTSDHSPFRQMEGLVI